MTASRVDDHVARTRALLARLREQADSAGTGPGSPVRAAVEELSASLDGLASLYDELDRARVGAQQRAERYLDLFRLAPDLYIVTDEDGVVLELNAVAEQKLGRTGRDLIGTPLLPLVAEPDRDGFRDALAELREQRGRLSTHLLRFESGPGFDASVSAVPELRDDRLEIRWMLRDVSELREREAFRDEIERHLEAVVWLHQLEPPRVLHVSPAYEVVWGRPLSSLYENPRDWIEHLHAEDRSRIEAAYARLLHGEAFDAEYRIVRSDGKVRWIHDRGRAFSAGRGHRDRVAGIAEDVTERKEVDAALQNAERRRRGAALSAERAEARERRSLASDLHDSVSQSLALARTKLAALCGEAAASDGAERLREIESLIAEADERTRTLTFRLSPPILHDLGLAAAAEWLAEDLQRRFGLHVSVTDEGLPDSLPFEVREALFRSLRELLINVARHAQTDEARVRLDREADMLMLTVEDGGIGFDVGREGSAGFGLVSIRERLEALGGELEIDSERGRGTRAHMTAPVSWDG